MKFFLRILPWGLTLLFLVFWQTEKLDNDLNHYYGEQGYTQMSQNKRKLESYISARNDFKTDLIAFNELNLIKENQFDGKYEPWISTELGLVKFDELGFAVKICQVPAAFYDTDCPSQL